MLLQRKYVADATQKRRSMLLATCFLAVILLHSRDFGHVRLIMKNG